MTRIIMKGEKYVFQKRERLLWMFHRWVDIAEFNSFADALIMKTMWVPEEWMKSGKPVGTPGLSGRAYENLLGKEK